MYLVFFFVSVDVGSNMTLLSGLSLFSLFFSLGCVDGSFVSSLGFYCGFCFYTGNFSRGINLSPLESKLYFIEQIISRGNKATYTHVNIKQNAAESFFVCVANSL